MPDRKRSPSRGVVADTSDMNTIGAGTLYALLHSDPGARRRLEGVEIRGVLGDAEAGFEILATVAGAKFSARVSTTQGDPLRFPYALEAAVSAVETAAFRARAAEADLVIADAPLGSVVRVQNAKKRQQ